MLDTQYISASWLLLFCSRTTQKLTGSLVQISSSPAGDSSAGITLCTALKPPRYSSRPEMSAADWTIKINPRAGIKFFPFQSNWDRGIEIYDF
ncbi:MAG: hypothetical protein WBL92_10585 [Methanothrix sp.]